MTDAECVVVHVRYRYVEYTNHHSLFIFIPSLTPIETLLLAAWTADGVPSGGAMEGWWRAGWRADIVVTYGRCVACACAHILVYNFRWFSKNTQ